MDKNNLKELKQIASNLKHQFNIGKSGITQTFIDAITKYLKANNIVKIKVLSAQNKDIVKEISNQISQKTDSIEIYKRGFTFVLYKE